jgi:hypothetical protein
MDLDSNVFRARVRLLLSLFLCTSSRFPGGVRRVVDEYDHAATAAAIGLRDAGYEQSGGRGRNLFTDFY